MFLETLGVLHRAAAGNNDLCRSQFRAMILGKLYPPLEGRPAADLTPSCRSPRPALDKIERLRGCGAHFSSVLGMRRRRVLR
jgi:hypothetical protein